MPIALYILTPVAPINTYLHPINTVFTPMLTLITIKPLQVIQLSHAAHEECKECHCNQAKWPIHQPNALQGTHACNKETLQPLMM